MPLFKKKKKPNIENPPQFNPPAFFPEVPEIKIKDISANNLKPVEIEVSGKKVEPAIYKPKLKSPTEIEGKGVTDTTLGVKERYGQVIEPIKPEVKPLKSEVGLTKPTIKGPVFVKITKYKSVLEIIEKLTKKLDEVEKDLRKLKEVKAREDEEIRKIDNELNEMKNKIKEIEKNLFSKLD